MKIKLPKPFPSRFGQPVLTAVDTGIFERTTGTFCGTHDTCGDRCCAHGADVDEPAAGRLLSIAEKIESFTGVARGAWFKPAWVTDPEIPGGRHTRTQTREGGCVFLNARGGRGCLIHSYCVEQGTDYQTLKPMICCLFPMTFDQGVLQAMEEFQGPEHLRKSDQTSIYEASRNEILYYFGQELMTILDKLQVDAGPLHTPVIRDTTGVEIP